MSTFLVANYAVVAVAVAVAVVLATRPHRRRTVAVQERTHPRLAALRARTSAARWVGIALAWAAFWTVAARDDQAGRTLAVAPSVAAATLVACLLVGDLSVRSLARGSRARATRRPLDAAPPRALTTAVLAVAAATAVALGWAAAVAGPDDRGRPGRALTWGDQARGVGGSAGPWPGAEYGLPIGLAAAVAIALTGLAVLAVLTRPRDDTDREVVRVDAWVRRRETESMVAACGAGVAATGLGVFLQMAGCLRSVAGGLADAGLGSTSHAVAAWACLAAGVASAVVLVACVTLLLVTGARPGRGRRRASALAEEAA